MKCPACGADLAVSDRQGVEVDYCPECRGVWLGRGEVDKILEGATFFYGAPPARSEEPLHAEPESRQQAQQRPDAFLHDLFKDLDP
ncbi:MAG: hypothetical protein GX537_08710 [Actinobacteria bacterium]|nr:hypothetical protein [Actinomycetota bacterium]